MGKRVRAYYRLGNLTLRGYVEDAGEGMYYFNTEERMEKGKQAFLVERHEVLLDIK